MQIFLITSLNSLKNIVRMEIISKAAQTEKLQMILMSMDFSDKYTMMVVYLKEFLKTGSKVMADILIKMELSNINITNTDNHFL